MIGQWLFSFLALLGCLAPSITPRHFPTHQFQASHELVSDAESLSLSRDFEPRQMIELAEQ